MAAWNTLYNGTRYTASAVARVCVTGLLMTVAGQADVRPICSEGRQPCKPRPTIDGVGEDAESVKIALGKFLFFDKRLSADGSVSCASCHDPRFAFTDGARVSEGIGGQEGTRNAPTVINSSKSSSQFWDGRAVTLEEQALGPMINPIEMGNTHQAVERMLANVAGYRELFMRAFGSFAPRIEQVGQAIAAFERTVVSENSPFDRFRAGDTSALTPRQQRGMDVFFGKGNCISCHKEPNFNDGRFHNLGVEAGKQNPDTGRSAITSEATDLSRFKTPSLRDVALTAPYMHDGSLASLEAVVEFYDRGGNPAPNVSTRIKPLALTAEEKHDLVSFLRALTGEGWQCISAPKEFPQ